MGENQQPAYSALDVREALAFIFNPRKDFNTGGIPHGEDLTFPSHDGVKLHARLYTAEKSSPTIVFFHGNGEMVADYNDVGKLYAGRSINLFCVEYRGYGRSDGEPSVTNLFLDARVAIRQIVAWLKENGHRGPLVVMGRSLGSAPALDLAAAFPKAIRGLILESGFANTIPLLTRLGVDVERLGLTEEQGLNNLGKIARYPGPTLILHGEFDSVIPFTEAELLLEASPSYDKTLRMILKAGHNDLFQRGKETYMEAVSVLTDKSKVARHGR